MLGEASVSKENSDLDLTNKMVSVSIIHILKGCAYILSEKCFHFWREYILCL